MIAVDSSSFIAYLEGEEAQDTRWVGAAIRSSKLVLPPVVLTEILSDPALSKGAIETIKKMPVLSVFLGLWERSGLMRSKILAKKLKARLADTLIAQACIDHNVPLITRDNDFRHFVKHGGLILFEG